MKQKLLFIDHQFHQKTKSSNFLIELLNEKYDVDVCSFDPYKHTIDECFKEYSSKFYDVLIVFQFLPKIEQIKKHLNFKQGNLIPMFDSVCGYPDRVWFQYKSFNIINFSKTLHEKIKALGLSSYYIQYFPKPIKTKDFGDEKSIFFWQRREEINLSTINKVLNQEDIEHIHLHKSPDPNNHIEDQNKEINKKITYSTWFETKKEMLKNIEKSALYMAPRRFEGIGMSFLEAMSMGRCVIAPNTPTMNEYIKNGENGFLYDFLSPKQLTIKNLREVQKNAFEYIKNGHEAYEKNKYNIFKWVETNVNINEELIQKMEKQPKVTIATITYNLINAGRESFFRECVESVQKQTYENLEHIVIDGASNDGTLDLIEEYTQKGWLKLYSEKDNGIYDAMNKGIERATGDYILFLNSDDYFSNPDGIKLSVEKILKENADFSYATASYLRDEKYFGVLRPVLGSFFVRMPFSHQTMLTSKEKLLKINKFDLNFNSAGDYDLILRLCLAGFKGVEVDLDFINYRLGGLSDSNQKQSIDECIKSFIKNYGFLNLENPEEIFASMFHKFMVPKVLVEKIKDKLEEGLKKQVEEIILNHSTDEGNFYKVNSYPRIDRTPIN